MDEDLLELLRPDLAVDLGDHFDVVFLQPTESRALFPGFAGLAFVMFEELDGVGELQPEIDDPEQTGLIDHAEIFRKVALD